MARTWLDVFPDDFSGRRYFQDDAGHAGANEGVAVGKPLGAGEEDGGAIARDCVTPHGLGRAVGIARCAGVRPLRTQRRDNLVYRRVRVRTAIAKDQQVPFARQALGDPMSAVLSEQLLVLGAAGAIGARIAPAVEKTAAFAAAPAFAARRLRGCRTVVDHPDFAEGM